MSRAAIIGAVAAGCLVVAAVAVWLLRPGPIPPAPNSLAATTAAAPMVQASSPRVPTAPVSPSPSPTTSPFVGSPWSVVSEYYGDVESGDYPAAWQLLGYHPNGQTYAQFVAGYACTGSQTVTETSSSGDQVSFELSAYDTCAGAEQTYIATDTVVDSEITVASITQLSGPGVN